MTPAATLGLPNGLQDSPQKQILFADIAGTGLAQLVEITPTTVRYWPSLGYGNFAPPITMANAPQFDAHFTIERLFLADLDGSGTLDFIYVEPQQITL